MSKHEIAKIIIAQLGGNQFVAMTGAKHFAVDGAGVSFRIGRNPKGINFVRVILNDGDLYDVSYCSLRSLNVRVKSVSTDLFCDQLQSDFTINTGLYTSLQQAAA